MGYGTLTYLLLYALLIVLFTFFYVSIVFNPEDLADNLKKFGGFIPGIRPGKSTSDFLYRSLNRLLFAGSIYLIIVALLPMMLISGLPLQHLWGIGPGLENVVQGAPPRLDPAGLQPELLLRRHLPAHRRGRGHGLPPAGRVAARSCGTTKGSPARPASGGGGARWPAEPRPARPSRRGEGHRRPRSSRRASACPTSPRATCSGRRCARARPSGLQGQGRHGQRRARLGRAPHGHREGAAWPKPDCAAGFILDGYPRNLSQAGHPGRNPRRSSGKDAVRAVELEVADDVIVTRLGSRRSCPGCGTVYNLVSSPPKSPGVCDKCSAGSGPEGRRQGRA